MKRINTLFASFMRLGALNRRLLLIIGDMLLLPLAVWLSFWLRLAQPFTPQFEEGLWLLPGVWLIGLPIYAISGQYQGLTLYVGSRALYRLASRNGLLVLLLAITGVLLRLPLPPRSSWVLLWVLLTGFTGAVRFALRDALLNLQNKHSCKLTRVAIYGAGAAGVQLSAALRLAGSHSVELFVDDSPELWRRNINGVPIQPPQVLHERQSEVDQVLLAIPSLSRSRRRQITSDLQQYGFTLLQVPSIEEITSGRARIDTLRPVQVEELLARDAVPPSPRLLGPGITGACVCVTGAGGSIGSEICRQILQLEPRRLLLLERSEPSLYELYQALQNLVPKGVVLEPVLGSATNTALIESLFRTHDVETVFHAAAYKHVPLVEANPLAGLANNVLSTRVVCRTACAAGVNKVVLISTDKAVRPTNVMGASKRVAELVVQAQAQELAERALEHHHQPDTKLAMVRFGNVLGSSGSVIPLFQKQIDAGGPITITHPKIIRYFMTIPEAAQLVLQAAVLAKGGDLFLLDMGKPVLIEDLAKQMLNLSGLSLRDATNPNGDIEIVYTGLRPGEKLYEELLIDAESESTEHPLIYRANEKTIPPAELWSHLDALEKAIRQHDESSALSLLANLVPEWDRQGTIECPEHPLL